MNTNTHEHPALQDLTLLTRWEAHNEPVHQRGKAWYVACGIIAIVGAIYGIITGSWSFSLVCVLCPAMYILVRDHIPNQHSMGIYEEGVLSDETFVRWEDVEGFWMVDTKQYSVLHIPLRTKNQPEFTILVESENVERIKLTLAQCTPELRDRTESLLDFISRFCKL